MDPKEHRSYLKFAILELDFELTQLTSIFGVGV